MERKYGDEQRDVIRKIKSDLIQSIENIFLETFEQLNCQGLGDAAVAKLTQELLIVKELSVSSLKEINQ